MSYIKIEVPQARTRRIFYSPGNPAGSELKPGESRDVKWFKNEDFNEQDAIITIPLPEMAEYKVTLYVSNFKGDVHLRLWGPKCEINEPLHRLNDFWVKTT